MLCRLTIAALFAIAAVSVSTVAGQSRYGKGAPGTGGIVPVISSNQAYMGNGKFAIQIKKARGGSSGLLGLSLKRSSFKVGATEVLVDPGFGSFLALIPVTFGGQKGKAGDGSTLVPLPLSFFPQPGLAGLDVHAQCVVLDYPTPGSPAATSGITMELTYRRSRSSRTRWVAPTLTTSWTRKHRASRRRPRPGRRATSPAPASPMAATGCSSLRISSATSPTPTSQARRPCGAPSTTRSGSAPAPDTTRRTSASTFSRGRTPPTGRWRCRASTPIRRAPTSAS